MPARAALPFQIDVKIGSAIQEATNIPCNCNDTVRACVLTLALTFHSWFR